MHRKILIILVAQMFVAQPLFAAGFGITFGESPESFGCRPLEGKTGFYSCDNPPKAHSAFDAYVLQASEKHGVCWLKGIGKRIDDNGYGSATRVKLDELAASLEKLYGPYEVTDIVVPDALWDSPGEWLMSIDQQERLYAYEWSDLDGTKPLLESVALVASSTGRSTGYVTLEYYSRNKDACEQSIRASEAGAL